MFDPGFSNGLISFDAEKAIFYAGQVITGSVRFNLDKPLIYSAINIECYGEAEVKWTENQTEEYNGVKRKVAVKYEGYEEYFRFTECLAGGTDTYQFPAGSQDIPFKFQVPRNAPSSYKGVRGNVKYHMNAQLLHAGPTMVEELLERNLEIVAPFDLNLGNASVREPIELVFEEVFGCGCWGGSPVSARVRLPARGFCPGQHIPITVSINNDTTVEIRNMIFELLVKECYRSHSPRAEYMPPPRVLAAKKTGAVLRNTERNFIGHLLVPDMVAPNLENCTIIDVGYFVKATIKWTGCQDDLTDETEICLGLVPLQDSTDGEYVHPMVHSLPDIPLSKMNTTTFPLPANAGFIIPANTPYDTSCPGKEEQMRTASFPAQFGPNENPPYPTQNIHDIPVSSESKPPPYRDYEIGFKMPDGLGDSALYPGNVVTEPHASYPTTNMMRQSQNGIDLRIYLPPLPMAATPSAPPPSS